VPKDISKEKSMEKKDVVNSVMHRAGVVRFT
jgi:hypothetical protein